MKKITAAELQSESDSIIRTAATLSVVSVVPEIMSFEKREGAFTSTQRTFLSRVFRDIALSAISLHAQLLTELMMKYEGVELDDTEVPSENITGYPEKFEELLRQFGGIKGNA